MLKTQARRKPQPSLEGVRFAEESEVEFGSVCRKESMGSFRTAYANVENAGVLSRVLSL